MTIVCLLSDFIKFFKRMNYCPEKNITPYSININIIVQNNENKINLNMQWFLLLSIILHL